MTKNIKDLLEETEKLKKENNKLQRELREARESIDRIKTGNIDALVVSNEKTITVYTEKTADEPYRLLIEKMHEGAVTVSQDGIILYCNSYFAKMVNQPLQKVTGTGFKNYIDQPSQERFESLLNQSREYTTEELYIYPKDGKAIPVLMSLTSLSLDNNFVLSIILTDLTVQKKNQEELKHRATQLELLNTELESVNKDLTSFTYVSSHDLQEPLRKIQNFAICILLEEEKNLSAKGKGYFGRMRQTAKRMQALIEDLLTFSRTKSSERKFEKTDLKIIIDEVKEDYEEVILEKKATIEIADHCEVNIIRFQFRQLIDNLISNSLKFSIPATAPHITFRSEIVQGDKLNNEKLSSEIDYCHITYTDNGIGFDPQYNERVFEVFQRLHSQEEYIGTGMGLAICKRIVENHNGIITASGILNKGVQFDIYIPAL
jgi:PAS domain S-box-containing protein